MTRGPLFSTSSAAIMPPVPRPRASVGPLRGTARFASLALLPLALAACQPSQEEPGPPPVRPVLTALAEPTESVLFGPFAGTVEPRYQSQLGFQIGGRVVARDVTVGDVVKKGQRLAALDPIVSRFDLTRAEAELADAQAQSENAAATEARTRRLTEGGNVTQAQLDAAVARATRPRRAWPRPAPAFRRPATRSAIPSCTRISTASSRSASPRSAKS